MKKLIAVCLMAAFVLTSKGEDKFALKSNNFALKFYKTVIETRSDENFVFSPVSVYSVCSLLHIASNGEISKELAALLSTDNTKEESLLGLQRFSEQLAEIGNEKNCLFKSWNFMWLTDELKYKKNFLDKTKGISNLYCESVNVKAKSLPDDIKKIILERSGNLLKDFPFAIPPLGDAFTAQNYAIFDGLWNQAFDLSRTSSRDFYNGIGESVSTMMMDSGTVGHKYYDEIKFEAVRMMYKGKRMSMLLIVPKGTRSFKTALSHVDAEYLEKIIKSFEGGSGTDATVVMPRFRISEASFSAKAVLESMGVKKIFAPGCDFSVIADGLSPLQSPDFTHNAAIVVNEKGTKAAAVSNAPFSFGGQPRKLVANRPFIFFVIDNESGLVCFMGHVFDPEKN